jgi:hypothetical protein
MDHITTAVIYSISAQRILAFKAKEPLPRRPLNLYSDFSVSSQPFDCQQEEIKKNHRQNNCQKHRQLTHKCQREMF